MARGHQRVRTSALPADGPGRLFAMGLLTPSSIRTRIAVLYVTLLAQFIDPDRGSVGAQSLVLGATQIPITLSVNGLIVLFTAARFLVARSAWLGTQRYAMGAVLGVLAVRLLTDRSRAVGAS